MRIKFTEEEVEDLIEFLERIWAPCTDQEVEQCKQIISKFKRAISYSKAGRKKYRYLRDAKWQKEEQARHDAFAKGLRHEV